MPQSPLFKVGRPVGTSDTERAEDVVATKRALKALRVGDERDFANTSSHADWRLYSRIGAAQNRLGLKADGVINPGGPTEAAFNAALAERRTAQARAAEAAAGVDQNQGQRGVPLGTREAKRVASAATTQQVNLRQPFPDKWAAKGWGGPRGPYTVPTLNNSGERIENILGDRPAHFDVEKNPKADPSSPWYEDQQIGQEAVAAHNQVIESEAVRQGVHPDLVKSIIFAENARGHYYGLANLAEAVGYADSLFPMNIKPHPWADLDSKGQDLSNPETNIKVGVALLKRIQDRINNPTAEKIASVWNYAGRENTNDFGAYVGRVYKERLWEKK